MDSVTMATDPERVSDKSAPGYGTDSALASTNRQGGATSLSSSGHLELRSGSRRPESICDNLASLMGPGLADPCAPPLVS